MLGDTNATRGESSAGPAGSAGPAARRAAACAPAPSRAASALRVLRSTSDSAPPADARSAGAPGPIPAPGAIVTIDDAYTAKSVPPPARAPVGPTHVITGIRARRINA